MLEDRPNAFQADSLGKAYRVYPSPAHRLKEILLRRPQHRLFHALQDVSFSIPQGGTFGIVGENGAGKSTLLKILANALQPTTGTIIRSGRIAALLELGAGFNPDLTGEENIFLNAYLLGLTKGEIQARKQSIIDFSELGEFIAQPVKNYSSGMVVRLGFSIATSVDPDVLIIDEALSVGDLHFQKKCVDRMMDFRRAGKTLVFCSHSMYFVQELCAVALWLDRGRSRELGPAGTVTNNYQNYARELDGRTINGGGQQTAADRRGTDVWIEKIGIDDGAGSAGGDSRGMLTVTLNIRCRRKGLRGHVGVAVIRNDELPCFGSTTKMDGFHPTEYRDGQTIRFRVKENPLLPGKYFVHATLGDESGLHAYDVLRSEPFIVAEHIRGFGVVRTDHDWEL